MLLARSGFVGLFLGFVGFMGKFVGFFPGSLVLWVFVDFVGVRWIFVLWPLPGKWTHAIV